MTRCTVCEAMNATRGFGPRDPKRVHDDFLWLCFDCWKKTWEHHPDKTKCYCPNCYEKNPVIVGQKGVVRPT